MLNKEIALKLIQDKPWHHDFEIIPGIRTKGSYSPENLWNRLQLPTNLEGMSLADIGASNGYFSFEAHKRGARVVAFDYRHKDNSGFGLAQYINGMNDIKHHQINVLDITKEKYGEFDIVLALGLFYHISDPYLALANCASLSRKQLLIESYCIDKLVSEEYASKPIMKFIPDPAQFPDKDQPNNDRSNFWGFTSTCLKYMVEDLGFKVMRIEVNQDRVFIDAQREVSNNNGNRLNIAYGCQQTILHKENIDDPQAWTIF